MKYNLSQIMSGAWKRYRTLSSMGYAETFAQCLRFAWSQAKAVVAAAAEAARKGIRRMHYSEYKRDYADCETVEGSYDKRTKTIEVMTLVRKGAKATAAKIMPRTSRTGLCPYCHTWCYGDCRA